MLLIHTAAMGALRRELVRTIGPVATRRLLLRAGYLSGERDAALARKVRPTANIFDLFAVGPQLHMLEGAAIVVPEQLRIDPVGQKFHGVFRWERSWEAEVHVRDVGPQSAPVCWTMLGYASGYTSHFMGCPVYFKEVACLGAGAPACRIEGRPQNDWPDGAELAEDYTSESFINQLETLHSQVETLRAAMEPTADEFGPLVGRSKAFAEAAELLRKAAATQVTVLLTGETGVGKERFARALHAMSARADKPFVAVNCAALPGELIESELFGAEKGAYTGASAARAGRFERADGGTLMLDEIGELPLPAQAKLLRVLQSGEVERLGSTVGQKVSVRVVAATNVNLEEAVAAGRFRRDLYYRINVYPIRVPALRDRAEDIELLASHLLKKFCALHGKRINGFTDKAIDAMRRHPWRGNVRELENLIERGVILASAGSNVGIQDLFPEAPDSADGVVNDAGSLVPPQPGGPVEPLYEAFLRRRIGLGELENQLLAEAVKRANGNLASAARQLGITRPQLSYRLSRMRKQEDEIDG